MGHVVLFHSAYGLRPAVLTAADRLRAAGHHVVTPDLYGAPAVDTIEAGFALLGEVGEVAVMGRARAALHEAPPEAVLAGFSMGAAVAGALLAERPAAAALLLLHGAGGAPEAVRPGLPVQLHMADPDEYPPEPELGRWQRAITGAGAELSVHRYPGVGHLYTDPDLPDHDPAAASRTWERAVAFLDGR
ncbi:dienelactone hydrolase family protein [Micromonospora sp. DT46]|uniref:dienelactone hydrolase family protein n=1 Tax=unclassified Micromonospora TaxID=2617518 RepID=UPI00124AF7B3|nr:MULTISPECIES: dienelactone hydrolase family protein [unclassified Micromonospora]KAB1130546.1 dienelactone hydrolase family protein [Micromonospora sp. AMSO12t]WSG00938.1 dienelactone hydrolase family protein [Micromonospora sp. NBC_01740]